MFRWVVKTEKFDTDNREDLDEYDAILNNPLCVVLSKKDEKLELQDFDEGKLTHTEQHIVFIVTWKEKVLL